MNVTIPRLAEYLGCPACKSNLNFSDGARIIKCQKCGPVGTWFPEERRMEWQLDGVDPSLVKRIQAERDEWDSWATNARHFDAQPTSTEWFSSTRTMRAAAEATPGFVDVRGKRILDIGSTCRHSVKFLKDGALSVDQIEVSPTSQRFALSRLQFENIDPERVLFHTSPAERLPFKDGAFDLVFSSGTIHHTARAHSLPEVHRVLKAGGEFLFIESSLPEHLYKLMQVSRKLRHADRGTDDPLNAQDFALARHFFQRVNVYRFNVTWLAWSLLMRTPWGRQQRRRAVALDERIGDGLILGPLLGTQCWVSGRKP
jgi:ubiquinone/menaquinone biosynthesis C-methylase UbiE